MSRSTGPSAAGMTNQPGTEQLDASAAIAGDPDALRQLWQSHRRWIAAILLAHKPRDADVDDLLQDVASIVVSKVTELRDEGSLKPWLRTVAISVARTAARRRAVRSGDSWWRRVRGARGESHSPVQHARTEGHPATEEGRKLMELAARLPDGYREPLLLKCVRGLSYKQIGELMGLPDTTIETRIARGRRMLRELAESDTTFQAAQPPRGSSR